MLKDHVPAQILQAVLRSGHVAGRMIVDAASSRCPCTGGQLCRAWVRCKHRRNALSDALPSQVRRGRAEAGGGRPRGHGARSPGPGRGTRRGRGRCAPPHQLPNPLWADGMGSAAQAQRFAAAAPCPLFKLRQHKSSPRTVRDLHCKAAVPALPVVRT